MMRNDAEDDSWLGPHVEVRLDVIEQNLVDAIAGADEIVKPLIDYDENSVEDETIDLRGVDVVVIEGTYTSLLKNLDCGSSSPAIGSTHWSIGRSATEATKWETPSSRTCSRLSTRSLRATNSSRIS